jgi:hypothetical protein
MHAFLIVLLYRHLKPGGYIEHIEISIDLTSDDGSLTKDSPLVKFTEVCSILATLSCLREIRESALNT